MMNPHMRQTFIDRVQRNKRPHTDHVVASLNAVLMISDRYLVHSTKFESDRHLTSTGKQAKLSEIARGELAPAFAKASSPIRKALRHVEAQRAGLTLPKPDKSDFVGGLQRQEIRAFLADMKPSERAKTAQVLVEDPTFRTAIFEMPAVLSGLDDVSLKMPGFKLYQRLKADQLMKLHGPRLAELVDTEEDYREAESAAVHVRGALKTASGLSREGFEAFMRPLEDTEDGAAPSFGEKPPEFDFDAIWDRVYADVMSRPEVAA